MSWKKWKIGLLIAALSAICDGAIVLLVDPAIALKALAIGLVVMMAKALGLYLKQHPFEEIETDTEIIRRSAGGGSTERSGDWKRPVTAIALGCVVFLGSGCMGNSLAKLAKELAKDPATLSLRVRVGTPYGTGEMDYARSGLTTNNASAGGGAIALNGAKKAGSE